METVNEIGTDRLDSNQTVVSRNESRIMKSNPKIKVSCRNIRLIAHFCNSSQLNPLIMNLSFQNYLNCTIYRPFNAASYNYIEISVFLRTMILFFHFGNKIFSRNKKSLSRKNTLIDSQSFCLK